MLGGGSILVHVKIEMNSEFSDIGKLLATTIPQADRWSVGERYFSFFLTGSLLCSPLHAATVGLQFKRVRPVRSDTSMLLLLIA